MAERSVMEGHVFISYVHEDAEMVDRMERVLHASGISVWRDIHDLWPGEDWRWKIREAIADDALVFIACFSDRSLGRSSTFQNEELNLAVEQIRLRRPDQPWLIPVRFSECRIPPFDLGAGRTLDSLQRVDLIGDDWDEACARLITGIQRLLPQVNPPPPRPRRWPLLALAGLFVVALVAGAVPLREALKADGEVVEQRQSDDQSKDDSGIANSSTTLETTTTTTAVITTSSSSLPTTAPTVPIPPPVGPPSECADLRSRGTSSVEVTVMPDPITVAVGVEDAQFDVCGVGLQLPADAHSWITIDCSGDQRGDLRYGRIFDPDSNGYFETSISITDNELRSSCAPLDSWNSFYLIVAHQDAGGHTTQAVVHLVHVIH
jgi:hypothetical protein